MAAAYQSVLLLLCLGPIWANALIAREAKLATSTLPPTLHLNVLNQSMDMAAEIASFIGSDAAKTQKLETACDPASQSQPQHDAVIVVLVPPSPMTFRNGYMMRCVESMKNIGDNNRAEVRLFHDEADHISKEDMEKMFAAIRPRKVCATKIRFAQFPPGFKMQLQHLKGLPDSQYHQWPWGYLHMIRFNFVDLLDPKIGMLAGFTNWMRMDADSNWEGHIPDEFANFDKDLQLGYLHNVENMDHGTVAQGLNQFTRDFARSHHIDLAKVPAVMTVGSMLAEEVKGYYNNLELGRISMFQTPMALEYTKEIVRSKGIYEHRWGDALLRRLVVELTGIKTQRVQDSTLQMFRHCGWAPLSGVQ